MKKQWSAGLACLAIFLLGTSTVLAQESKQEAVALSEEESSREEERRSPTVVQTITVTATLSPREVKETPASVTIIDDEDIKEWMFRGLQDLVKYEPGVYVANDLTRLGSSGVNIRGIGGNRVNTEIDGIRTAEQFEFGPFAMPRYSLDVDTLKSVEIVKSAGSALYGSDALGGVLSFETKGPDDYLSESGKDTAVQAKFSFDGRRNELSETLVGAVRSGNVSASLLVTRADSGETRNRGGLETSDFTRTAPNPQTVGTTNLLAKVNWKVGEGNEFKLASEFFNSQAETDVFSSNGVEQLGPIATNISGTTAVDQQQRLRISLDHVLKGQAAGFLDQVSWKAFFQKNQSDQETTELRVTESQFGATRIQRTGLIEFDQSTWGLEARAQKSFGGPGFENLLTFGVDFSNDRFDQFRDRADLDLDTGDPDAYQGSLVFPSKYFPESDSRRLGIYIQDEIRIANGRLSLLPGLRFDSYKLDANEQDEIYLSGNQGADPPVDLTDSRVSPRFGIVVQIIDELSVFGQVAGGFRAPPYSAVNLGFTNLGGGYTTLSNPGLAPETSTNLEAGLRLALDRGSLSMTIFNNDFENFIELSSLGFNPATNLLEFQSQNFTEVTISGFELAGDWYVGGGLSLRGSFASITGDIIGEEEDRPLNSIAPPTLVLGARFAPPRQKWSLGVTTTLVSDKDVERIDRSAFEQFAAPGYELVDLTGEYQFTDKLGLQLGVLNLLDQTYWAWPNVLGLSQESEILDRFTNTGISFSAAARYRM